MSLYFTLGRRAAQRGGGGHIAHRCSSGVKTWRPHSPSRVPLATFSRLPQRPAVHRGEDGTPGGTGKYTVPLGRGEAAFQCTNQRGLEEQLPVEMHCMSHKPKRHFSPQVYILITTFHRGHRGSATSEDLPRVSRPLRSRDRFGNQICLSPRLLPVGPATSPRAKGALRSPMNGESKKPAWRRSTCVGPF